MNVAVIFAGGTGSRMNLENIPKQFLTHREKPILIYTLEKFQSHDEIDGVIVVMLADWIGHTWKLLKQYDINKVVAVVPGGETGLQSRFNGLLKAEELYPEDTVILMHDGVRPFIDRETISKNIASVKEHGSAITVAPAVETVALKTENGLIGEIMDRSLCQLAKAPQCFYLRDLVASHRKVLNSGRTDLIDTAFLMQSEGYPLFIVEGRPENIKITTPNDYYTFCALVDAEERDNRP